MNTKSLLFTTGLLLVLLVSAEPASAQNKRQQTQQRLDELREQIAEDEERLSQTAEREQTSLQKLEELERQITVRKELIENYRQRETQLNLAADSIRTSMNRLKKQINELRAQYQRRASHAYMYGRLHDLALILSAQSINQMLVRVQYLRRFTDQRRRRLSDVRAKTETLRKRRAELQATRDKTKQLIQETEKEQQNLVALQSDRQQMIGRLRNQRETISQALEQKRSRADKFEQRMQQLMAETRRRNRETATPADRAEFEALSGSFQQNEGRLPWPVDGVVTEPFGEVVNPVHGTRTPNPGILISTKASAGVRAVFRGQVGRVFTMPEFGTCAAVQHGAFSSVYCNFSLLYVEEGQSIAAGDLLGRAGTTGEPKGKGLFFSLFKSGRQDPLDPLPWLSDR